MQIILVSSVLFGILMKLRDNVWYGNVWYGMVDEGHLPWDRGVVYPSSNVRIIG